MIGKHYDLESTKNKTVFYFMSEGPKGAIAKKIGYQPIGKRIWNLYFGDVTEDGEDVNDSVVTNNDDLYQVMNTVAQSVYVFLEKYPNRIVRIVPVDDKRKMLYNTIFKRRFHEIEPIFEVYAQIGRNKEPYSATKNYNAFYLSLKTKNDDNEK